MLLQEKDYLDIYKKQKEDHLGWGSSTEWTNQDFDTLSELIFEKTGVRLSASTLKRVWGKVKYDSAPTLTTLNTLAQFSGFENWRSFRASIESKNGNKNGLTNGNGNGIHHEIDLVPGRENETIVSKKKFYRTVAIRVVVSIALFSIVALIYVFTMPGRKVDPSKVIFTNRVTSDDLPNSVVFTYDVADNKVDSAVIQQSWDPQRRESVSAKNHQHTSLYYYPGFFEAKLLINGEIVKEEGVLIKTNGWIGILSQGSVPAYLGKDEIKLEGNSMQVDAQLLFRKTGKTVFNQVWTEFYDVRNFDNVDASNFSLTTTLQNTSTKEESVCQLMKIVIIGTGGVISIPFGGKGCTSALSAFIEGVSIDGKENDLSFLGCDFLTPQQITCKVRDKRVVIYRDGKEIFKPDIEITLEKVVGLIIGFEGPGRIVDLRINSLN